MTEPIKFNKILFLNDKSLAPQRLCVDLLFQYMEETNTKHSIRLLYFSLRTRDSMKCLNALEMILEWQGEVLERGIDDSMD